MDIKDEVNIEKFFEYISSKDWKELCNKKQPRKWNIKEIDTTNCHCSENFIVWTNFMEELDTDPKYKPYNGGFYFYWCEVVSGSLEDLSDCEIEVYGSGYATFEGMKHVYFGQHQFLLENNKIINMEVPESGYFNYPNAKKMRNVFQTILDLEIELLEKGNLYYE